MPLVSDEQIKNFGKRAIPFISPLEKAIRCHRVCWITAVSKTVKKGVLNEQYRISSTG